MKEAHKLLAVGFIKAFVCIQAQAVGGQDVERFELIVEPGDVQRFEHAAATEHEIDTTIHEDVGMG